MADKVWKQRERKISSEFGTERTPLSGGNGKQTRSDSLHERLFLEVKGRKSHAVIKLYDETKELARKEGKIPVIALWQPSRRGYLLCLAPEDLQEVEKFYKGGS